MVVIPKNKNNLPWLPVPGSAESHVPSVAPPLELRQWPAPGWPGCPLWRWWPVTVALPPAYLSSTSNRCRQYLVFSGLKFYFVKLKNWLDGLLPPTPVNFRASEWRVPTQRGGGGEVHAGTLLPPATPDRGRTTELIIRHKGFDDYSYIICVIRLIGGYGGITYVIRHSEKPSKWVLFKVDTLKQWMAFP